jgi:hypothetical protein
LPEISLAEKKTVLEILGSFKGTGPLRELLAQLNYDPLNEPVSRKDWPEAAQVALGQDARIYGQAAGEFYVIYAQLAADKLKLMDERAVVPQLLKTYPYALFVFSDKSQTNFHFVNVKWENNQKRRLYRRITVGPQERMRTAAERLSLLDMQTIEAGLFGITAQEIQDRHDEAFDVAKVSKSFFDEYKRVFEVMRDAVKGFGTSDEEQDRRHLFTQHLFNRLMFLRFIQKKGWLTIDGSTDYLATLWASHGKLRQDGKNFYTDRLRLLFAALNNERAGIVLQGRGGAIEATIGKVKYLNGGLFEETDEDKDPKVRIADAPFNQIFDKASGLFEAFNFTITESTPLDIEIAVDPEMLGKIFEELVTGRHDSGSYYTPKPIVSFMCREALKGYLETRVPDEDKRALTRFIDKHEPDEVRNAEAVLNALRRVTVCDPACGSGAYLLGMMHELLDLRQCLFQTRQVDNKTMYQRKLDIIQTNIYGVDLAEFAVNIARLRLWLSLAVDYDGPEPQPLPNLDYKIEVGDSICSPSPGAAQMGFAEQFVKPFAELKRKYLVAHHAEKSVLRAQVDEVRQTILSHACPGEEGFVWGADFAEVFIDGGFDVVLANPPYVRMELFKEIKPVLRKNFPSIHSDRTDLYCYFYARAVELLSRGGCLAFISSGKWLRSGYGGKLRTYMGTQTHISAVIDFGDLPVFESASAYPMIFLAQKDSKNKNQLSTWVEVPNLGEPYPDIAAVVSRYGHVLPPNALVGTSWTSVSSTQSSKVEERGTSLREYVGGKIFYGVKTGLNEAFVINGRERAALIHEDRRCGEFIKPLISGRDIDRWKTTSSAKWLIYLPHGVDISGAGPILKHLKKFKDQLEDRATKQEWYELQQPQYRYSQYFDQPKIVYQVFQVKPCFAFDTAGSYVTNSVYVIPSDDLFLLAVMNSTPFWDEVSRYCSKIQNGYQLMLTYFERVRIPFADALDRAALSELTQKCLQSPEDKDAESEIDKRVAVLYGKS